MKRIVAAHGKKDFNCVPDLFIIQEHMPGTCRHLFHEHFLLAANDSFITIKPRSALENH
jgi:hypothetical protein